MKILCRTDLHDIDLYVASERSVDGARWFDVKDRTGKKIGNDIKYVNIIQDMTGLRAETSGFSDTIRVYADGATKDEVEDMLHLINTSA